jgi:hypothetical protein
VFPVAAELSQDARAVPVTGPDVAVVTELLTLDEAAACCGPQRRLPSPDAAVRRHQRGRRDGRQLVNTASPTANSRIEVLTCALSIALGRRR